jgi:hypothetical protein
VTTLIVAEPVRAHVQLLRSTGASWQAIGQAAGVGAMTVFDVVHQSAKVSQATAQALLAVDQRDLILARVDANGAMLRLRSLQAMGHSSARVARAIGCHQQSIQRIINGRAATISIRLHRAIVIVFDVWWDKSPPERTRSERVAASAARCRAERGGWCQAAALDEELLDTPGYQPFAGYRQAHGTGLAPELCLGAAHLDEPTNAASCKKGTPAMSQSAEGYRREAEPRSTLSSIRSAECSCEAQPGDPCTENGDHLERYLRAAKRGAIDRQQLKDTVSTLEVIAPHVVVQPKTQVIAHARPQCELEAGA